MTLYIAKDIKLQQPSNPHRAKLGTIGLKLLLEVTESYPMRALSVMAGLTVGLVGGTMILTRIAGV